MVSTYKTICEPKMIEYDPFKELLDRLKQQDSDHWKLVDEPFSKRLKYWEDQH